MLNDQLLLRLAVQHPETIQPSESLRSWLQRDPEYRGILVADQGPPHPGQLGTADAVVAAVAAPSTLFGLLSIIKVWVLSRRSHVAVHLTVKDTALAFTIDSSTDPNQLMDSIIESTGFGKPKEGKGTS